MFPVVGLANILLIVILLICNEFLSEENPRGQEKLCRLQSLGI